MSLYFPKGKICALRISVLRPGLDFLDQLPMDSGLAEW
jgi:hypothetical protein